VRNLGGFIAVVVGISACTGSTPTALTQPSCHDCPPASMQFPVCTPVQIEVHCTVTMQVLGRPAQTDITDVATWSVSEDPFSAVPTTIAGVTAPGVIVPFRPGDIYIRADYFANSLRISNTAQHSYAVSPTAPAVVLSVYLAGSVFEFGSFKSIDNVLIEIIDGPDAGRTARTIVNGSYLIKYVAMNVPFTVRASKVGYEALQQRHPGIVDEPTVGNPLNNHLNLFLKPSVTLMQSPSEFQ